MLSTKNQKRKGVSAKTSKGFGNQPQVLNNNQPVLTRRHIFKVSPDGTFTPLVTFDFIDGSVTFWGGADHE